MAIFNYSKIFKNKQFYIIAEIGVNHNGNLILAKKLVTKAKDAGANAVKLQLYETNKEQYRLLKPGTILRHKAVPSFKIKILSTNWEGTSSEVITMESGVVSVNVENSIILVEYEPF